jgi:hypothetical protein
MRSRSKGASFATVLAAFEALLGQMEALAMQEQGGHPTGRAAVARRRMVRQRLHHELLRHLVTVAQVAAAEQPGLPERYNLPSTSATNEAFRTFARQLLEQGQAERELLSKYGLADKLLDDLAAGVDDFDKSVVESNQARRDHVGARAELKAVSDRVMQLVGLLDGLNRYRFSGNAETRAAWESAKNVVSGPTAQVEESLVETPPQAGVEERPAA